MKIFFDTSSLIEFIKGNKKAVELFYELSKLDVEGFINDVVFSEFLFHYIRLSSQISPFKVKEKGEISKFIKEKEPKDFIEQFQVLTSDEKTTELAYEFMRTYNLLPNDALILASCKQYDVSYLLSLDEDLGVCEREGIVLLNSIEKLNKVDK
jgi:predicted nucleic acid-binding protein